MEKTEGEMGREEGYFDKVPLKGKKTLREKSKGNLNNRGIAKGMRQKLTEKEKGGKENKEKITVKLKTRGRG